MITVFGSLNGDHITFVETLPKPGETRVARSYALLPGGKGANQAVAAARCQATVYMCGSVGDDPAGELSRQSLAQSGVRCEGLRTVASSTGAAFVWVDASGENAITIARNANDRTCAADVPASLLERGGHALVQMEVPLAESWAFLARASASGMTTVCNLAPYHPIPDEAWAYLDWLIVNTHEATALLGGPATVAALRDLSTSRGTCLVVTQGARGAVMVMADGTAWSVSALDVTPVDTTGAGDAFVGAFVARLDAGDAPDVAMRYASVASGLACLQLGAQSALPTHDAIARALSRVELPVGNGGFGILWRFGFTAWGG